MAAAAVTRRRGLQSAATPPRPPPPSLTPCMFQRTRSIHKRLPTRRSTTPGECSCRKTHNRTLRVLPRARPMGNRLTKWSLCVPTVCNRRMAAKRSPTSTPGSTTRRPTQDTTSQVSSQVDGERRAVDFLLGLKATCPFHPC